MINVRINVSKIDKEKLYHGTKGVYLNIILAETPNDQYGNDYIVFQDIPKEEREAGGRGAILGNAKKLVPLSERQTEKPLENPVMTNVDQPDDDLSF